MILRRLLFAKLIVLLLVLSGGFASAQCHAPKIKDHHIFSSPQDYRSADFVGVKCMKWLLETPISQCTDERNVLDAFVLVWLSGHPDFIVRLEPQVFPFFKSNPELLFPAIYGMAMAQIENGSDAINPAQLHSLAANAILDVTNGDRNYRGNSDLKHLRKLRRKNRLEGHFETFLAN